MDTIIIEVGRLRSKIVAGKFPVTALKDEMSFLVPDHKFSPLFKLWKAFQVELEKNPSAIPKQRMWDGYIRYLTKTLTFNTSLLPRVLNFFKNREVQLTHDYNLESFTNIEIKTRPGITLRDYQVDAIKTILKKKRGICKIATGGGKTLIATSILLSINRPSVFIVHKKDLLYQTHSELLKTFSEEDVGIIGDGKSQLRKHTIAMVQTATNPKFKHHFDEKVVLFADEVHHAKAVTWSKLLNKIPATIKIGLTATPDSKNLLPLESTTGPLIVNITTNSLTKQNYLSKAKVLVILYESPPLSDRYSYSTAYRDGIVSNLERNEAILQSTLSLISKKRLPILIIVKEIQHLNLLGNLLHDNKIRHRLLSGQSDIKDRKKSISLLNSGRLDVVVATSIFEEGVDIPSLKGLILAAGGKSQKLTIQRVGRSLRKTKDDNPVIIVDFYETNHKYLIKHSKQRIAVMKREKHEIVFADYRTVEDLI